MSFFKLHKPMVYKYKPIYYDPEKEARKEREQRMAAAGEKKDGEKKDGEPKEFKTSIRRGTFRQMADKNRDTARSSELKKSNTRLIIIILILFLVLYLLIK